MTCNNDPLSLVYTELWNMAEANCGLTNQVKLHNRIRYDQKDRDPEKRNYNDADTPELALMCAGLGGNICNTSSTSMLSTRYSWIIVTGDLRVNYRMLPVEWALFEAMHLWRERLGKLTWNDKAFCKKLNMLDVQEGILQSDRPHDGPQGWMSIWGIQVDMYFSLTDLQTQGA